MAMLKVYCTDILSCMIAMLPSVQLVNVSYCAHTGQRYLDYLRQLVSKDAALSE